MLARIKQATHVMHQAVAFKDQNIAIVQVLVEFGVLLSGTETLLIDNRN